jgi:transcription antitermination factor NusG
MKSSLREDNRLHWFVMRCQNAEKIEAFINEYNADAEVSNDDKVEDLFIPALAIRRRMVTREAVDLDVKDPRQHDQDRKNNELRSVMRHYVFLYARPSAFDRLDHHLPTQYWNMGHTRLFHYCDYMGEAITVPDDTMTRFISGCLEYLEHFEIRTKEAAISEGLLVTVRKGAFKDFKAEILNIHYKADGVRFTIAIRFFANDKYIYINDRRPEDVILTGQSESLVFNDDFIDRIQTALLSVFSRQVHKKETPKSHDLDLQQLRQLYYLRHAIIDDPLRSLQLDALMSLCASLSKNEPEKSKYNRIIKQRLKALRQQPDHSPEGEAYLLAALAVSTKSPDYRDDLKRLLRHHLPTHPVLNRFLSLIRKL